MRSDVDLWMATYANTPSYVLRIDELVENVKQVSTDWWYCIEESLEYISHCSCHRLSLLPEHSPFAYPFEQGARYETAREKSREVYRSQSHKPEITVALSEFEAFAGFKSQNGNRGSDTAGMP
jgi:hypothetical protein